jgi:hypothetical protein
MDNFLIKDYIIRIDNSLLEIWDWVYELQE